MAAQTTTAAAAAERQEQREADKQGKSQLVVVELAKRRTVEQIRRLRKGRGKLVDDIDEVVAELVEAGTIKANAQPVVIVVREAMPAPFPFNMGPPPPDDDAEDDDD